MVEINPTWAPIGAKRFLDLVQDEFFKECYIHRVIPGFICQFGIAADPTHYNKWSVQKLKDDPVKVSNTRGYVRAFL